MINYGFYKELQCSFDKAAEIILKKLKEHNFTIVTQIDLKDKFATKLNIDYPQYTILGLCNPSFALQAVEIEKNAGLFFPCNMVVFEQDDSVGVSIIKPSVAMEMVDNPHFKDILHVVEKELKELFDDIEIPR